MNSLKNIIVFLLVMISGRSLMAQTTHRIYKLVQEPDEIPFVAYLNESVTKTENHVNHVSYKRIFLQRVKPAMPVYNMRATIRGEKRAKESIAVKLIRSNLALTFRLSKTFKLKLSYL